MTGNVVSAMIDFYAGDIQRINHFLKVYALAKNIGECEGLSEEARQVLEIAAVTHDIGIKPSEEKYADCTGPHQEREGPPVARAMLHTLGYAPALIDRVCYLIAHHHTYTDIDSLDYQILVEADFLVNAYEDGMEQEAIQSVRERVFRTGTGKMFLDRMFPCAIPQQ